MTTAQQIQQAFVVDGKIFHTKADAERAIREPLVLEALSKLTQGDAELAKFLSANEETLETIFDTGTLRRVTKSEKNKLDKALEALALTDDKALAFLREHKDAISESFRWPAQKRLKPEEKLAEINAKLLEVTENNTDLSAWIVANKDALLEAFKAGQPKREVSQKAADGLAAYRAKKAAEKAEEAAAIAEGPEAHEAYKAKKAAEAAEAAAEAEAAAAAGASAE